MRASLAVALREYNGRATRWKIHSTIFTKPNGSVSIKCSAGGTRLWTFLMSSVFSLNAEQGRYHNRANKLLQE